MVASLRSETLRGVFYSLCERVGEQGAYFIISIVLARLLAPEQFGLIAMLAVFIQVAKSFLDSGFGAALIQKKNATPVDECSIFYFNILVGFFCAGLLCISAPWIAAFYGRPILIPLTRVLSLVLIINAFGLVQTTLLTKHIDFKTQFRVSVAATVLSGAVGIIMALRGFGVWSLAAQTVTRSFLRTLLLWLFHDWRPKLLFSFRALGEMFGFGSRLLASALLNRAFENIYLVVIGRLFSAADLGLYGVAKRIAHQTTLSITNVVTRVTFPVFSKIQDDDERLRRGMRKALALLAFVNFPVMIGLALVSKPLIYLLLTEKWAAAVPWLQLLCVAGILYPLHSLHLNILKAKGRSDLFFRLEVVKKVLIITSIAITYRWGITAMIYGQICISVLCYYVNSYYTARLIDYRLKQQLLDLAPYLVVSIFMGCGVYLAQWIPCTSEMVLFVIQILLGASLYGVLTYVLRLPACIDAVSIVGNTLRPHMLCCARS